MYAEVLRLFRYLLAPAKKQVIWWSLRLSICWVNYAKIHERILMKFRGGVDHCPGRNWLDFGGDPESCGFWITIRDTLSLWNVAYVYNLHCISASYEAILMKGVEIGPRIRHSDFGGDPVQDLDLGGSGSGSYTGWSKKIGTIAQWRRRLSASSSSKADTLNIWCKNCRMWQLLQTITETINVLSCC